jgi:hypothetical protein
MITKQNKNKYTQLPLPGQKKKQLHKPGLEKQLPLPRAHAHRRLEDILESQLMDAQLN